MELFNGKYELQQLLGRGAFAEVWQALYVQSGDELALKIYAPSTGMEDDGIDMLNHEFSIMLNVNHPNLLKPIFFDTCDRKPFLVLPYCRRGNVNKLIGHINEEEAWKMLHDIASALECLHSQNPPIIHQDIKPSNILISDNGSYVLTDFGVSTHVKSAITRLNQKDTMFSSAGTISYMAPEKFSRNNQPIMANDTYSLGTTMYEMLTGTLPFGNDGGLIQRKGAEIPELMGDYSQKLKDTIEACLELDPTKRIKISELVDISTRELRGDKSTRPMNAYQPESENRDSSSTETVVNPNGYTAPAAAPLPSGEQPLAPHAEKQSLSWITIVVAAVASIIGGVVLFMATQ